MNNSIRESWGILGKSGGRRYLLFAFVFFFAGIIFYSLGTINYGIYTGFLAVAITLAVTALAEVRFYEQKLMIEGLGQKLDDLKKSEEERHPK